MLIFIQGLLEITSYKYTFCNTYEDISFSMPISAPCMKNQKLKQKSALVCKGVDSSVGIFPAGSPLGLANRK